MKIPLDPPLPVYDRKRIAKGGYHAPIWQSLPAAGRDSGI
jgi:hypothetical protein